VACFDSANKKPPGSTTADKNSVRIKNGLRFLMSSSCPPSLLNPDELYYYSPIGSHKLQAGKLKSRKCPGSPILGDVPGSFAEVRSPTAMFLDLGD
jgi:hypothetical protein